MQRPHRWALTLLTAGALSAPVLVTGCMHHHDYNRDGGYAQSDTWNDGEQPYYAQWENDTHREHRDWNQRSSDEQQQYWQWRRDHGGDRPQSDGRDRGHDESH